jgi:transcriptional regulator with XRE-family HTH domain
MAPSSDNVALQRLAELIKKRRVELGMHKIDVARAAGITITTYMKVEDALSVRDVTYGKIEPVLDWVPGTCKDVLFGAVDAALVETSPSGGVVVTVPAGVLEEEIRRAVQDVIVGGTDLQASDIRRLNAEVIELLKQRGTLPGEGD